MLGTSTAAAQTAPTRGPVHRQADPICLEAKDDLAAAVKAATRALKRDQFKRAGNKYIRSANILADATERLAVLPRPPQDAALLQQWIDNLRTQVEITKKLGRAIKNKSRRVNKLLRQVQRAAEDSTTIVAGYGFQHCA